MRCGFTLSPKRASIDFAPTTASTGAVNRRTTSRNFTVSPERERSVLEFGAHRSPRRPLPYERRTVPDVTARSIDAR